MNGGGLGESCLDYEGLLLVHCASDCMLYSYGRRGEGGFSGEADHEWGKGPQKGRGQQAVK